MLGQIILVIEIPAFVAEEAEALAEAAAGLLFLLLCFIACAAVLTIHI